MRLCFDGEKMLLDGQKSCQVWIQAVGRVGQEHLGGIEEANRVEGSDTVAAATALSTRKRRPAAAFIHQC